MEKIDVLPGSQPEEGQESQSNLRIEIIEVYDESEDSLVLAMNCSNG